MIIAIFSILFFNGTLIAKSRSLYVSLPAEDGTVFSFLVIGNKFIRDHVEKEIRNCSSNSIKCIELPLFTFALPVSGLHSGDKWKINDIEFEFISDSYLHIWGMSIKIQVINSNEGISFYYSNDRGLVGMRRTVDHDKSVVLLSDNFGVGYDWGQNSDDHSEEKTGDSR